MTKDRFYITYRNIVQRTTNEKTPFYKYYGGRGIKNEWKSFEEFYVDRKGLGGDRADTRGRI